MTTPHTLQSFTAGRWVGTQPKQALRSAINGHVIAHTHEETLNFEEMVAYARSTGLQTLLKTHFQDRARTLKALAAYLMERKEELYAVSSYTGGTRSDNWIDVEGGIGTLFAYASIGGKDLPSSNVLHEGPPMRLGANNHFIGSHVLVPRRGIALHINAFNFPIWGMLEKFAPSYLAGMPCLVKPASATSYVAEKAVRVMMESGLLPAGCLQLIVGGTGDLFDRLEEPDVVTFTGSADTALMLKAHPNLLRRAIPFNAEADSLNCAILAPDVTPDDPEFDLYVKEVAREMSAKAGQKCTAIRRAIVPRHLIDAVGEALAARLKKIVVGDPAVEGVRMGALASHAQQADVGEKVALLRQGNQVLLDGSQGFAPKGEGTQNGAFFAPTLLRCDRPLEHAHVHNVEAFGPVSTLMAYDDYEEGLHLATLGRGSLVGSLVTKTPALAAQAVPSFAAWHGRLLVLDREAALESTGHGSPLPKLKHGGPGRAGGGEELGGLRSVKHYLQRCAVQGSPTMMTAVTGEYQRGGAVTESEIHPFRRHFEDVEVGMSLLTHRRTVGEADIVAFGGLSGDYFYMHFDEVAAKESAFGKRIAHGYFVLSAAAGLFVSPAPGPVLANYGLENLRFITPVAIGDTIQARLTAKRKIDRPPREGQPNAGVVGWDVAVTNQRGELCASYEILTLVAKKGEPS
ncbi:phenylacetic acid degradation bifunctional protein PaaZ [Inhella gelatinilytica]|uniref:Phenylacetic acid degradation bifunctional protein PaaZ n=1 Tax=Inhella gelatinilytica TaxID=2795030 RepID=A0A931IU27_9BURK|nr:phenylacetic acid degradation bifunctional protein PaaZ [Inhella gelatinilytica]MBH9551967.1 phenylacetic acid degradation bifunctional protein PaaZ [Inhella gelatinilytica]